MYIDFENKFVFVAVPKTASRSIHGYFSKNISDNKKLERIWTKEKYHYPISKIEQEYPETKEFYRFAFIRNPFDRMVSTFLDFTKNKSSHRDFAEKFDSLFKSFPEFILNFKDTEWSDEIHMHPGAWYTFHNDEPINFIGRYENIGEDFDHVLNKIDLPNKGLNSISRMGKTDRDANYRQYYKSDKMIQAVYDFYIDDIKYFNYEF